MKIALKIIASWSVIVSACEPLLRAESVTGATKEKAVESSEDHPKPGWQGQDGDEGVNAAAVRSSRR